MPSDEESDVIALREEVRQLRVALSKKEQQLVERLRTPDNTKKTQTTLTNEDISRFSRQLILLDFGVPAQLKLKHGAFLIVGMGGLGCPAAQYLAAAGCGRLGIVDYDKVERSNFHRQTLHTETRVGLTKVESARLALAEINMHCQVEAHCMLVNSKNAMELLAKYDVILDCSDNVATRYLLNDACVLLHKPLVSGSALQLDGQLTVYNYEEKNGPCYRCLFPVPPPAETVTNCSDGGVLGAVTGVIGALQALEAIKILVGLGDVLGGRLLIFDGTSCAFRNIKLRTRRKDCAICSATPTITDLIDCEQFCGMSASDKDTSLMLLTANERLSAKQYKAIETQPHILIDVRSNAEFQICHLPKSINVPIKTLLNDDSNVYMVPYTPVVVLCRRGNDSQIAVQHLRKKFPEFSIHDIIGGLHAWHYQIDNDFPIY